MDELFTDLEKLAKVEKRVAMATLVGTRGTSPKREGAKMWVGEEGRILGSVTIGGCVDARVIAEAEKALATSQPRLLQVDLDNEDAWEMGLSCAGSLDVLIEPFDLTSPNSTLIETYQAVQSAIGQGKTVAIVTPLNGEAQRLIVFEDENRDLDDEVRGVAFDLMRKRKSATVSIGDPAVEIFFEVHGPPPTLIVFGAGHLSMPLVSLARDLGLKTIVVDGRPRFATRERFPEADELLIGIPSEIAQTLAYNSSTFVVLTAHDYKYDLPVLKVVLPAGAAYVGLLGSKRRGKAIKEFLKDGGMDESLLDRLHVPTGLDIGADSAPEIALSILAEAVAIKSGRSGASLKKAEHR
ncbi:MAG TPA: XdhC/CoxI family protein [Pyrinomonadaceae bacterium]|jgi:xanthine dehydrogenase accessory factor|nr:XdhC/CoxI family protein [Pyrinomonadaceae bacterium]